MTIRDTNLQELAHLLPRAMPAQIFQTGDEVLVRLKKHPQLLQKARVTSIVNTEDGSQLRTLTYSRDGGSGSSWVINVSFDGQERANYDYPCFLLYDILYTMNWVSGYLGNDTLRTPKILEVDVSVDRDTLERGHRFGRLVAANEDKDDDN